MPDIIERVARAICMSRHGGYPVDMEDRLRDGTNWKGHWWLQATQDARAAIEAMREADEGMCEAGAAYYHDNWRKGHAKEDTNTLQIWQAMIDKALTGQGG